MESVFRILVTVTIFSVFGLIFVVGALYDSPKNTRVSSECDYDRDRDREVGQSYVSPHGGVRQSFSGEPIIDFVINSGR